MSDTKTTSNDSLEITKQVADAMLKTDNVVKALGMTLDEIKPGYASLSMKVRSDMLNSHSTCHGGMTFTLADTAFAYACNSRNEKTVALACTITFALAVYEGDTLTARAEEEVLNGRTGLYNIVITNSKGDKVAFFRGNSYKTSHLVDPQLPKLSR